MSSFEPNKRHLRELLIYFFNLKKSAAEAHRLLVEAYGEAALSERSCREWFHKFKNGEFDVEDKERSGRPKVYEDAELEALLEEDSCQTQEELALTLGVTQQAISHRLKSLGMIQKQGNWVPYELKPRNVERRFCTCEMLLARHKRKSFLHRIVTGDEKWIHYDNPKKRKSWGPRGHASTSTAKPNIHGKKLMLCIWWDQLGVVYYELLKPNETITGALYRTQLMRLSRALKEKRAHYYSRHDKIILLHDNARPHVAAPVKTYLETLNWEVLPHPPYSPDIAPSDYHLFRSMAHGLSEQHFTSYEDTKNWVDSWIASKDYNGRWIGRGGPVHWPAKSPDLTSPDFFWWGLLKTKVYQQVPTTLENMIGRIRNACAQIEADTLLSCVQSFEVRINKCIEVEGHQFEHLLN